MAGSGKTTYVTNMADLLRGLGRKVAIINLDPANEKVGYTADIEVSLKIDLCVFFVDFQRWTWGKTQGLKIQP